jgi:hypothetical protein
MNQPSVDAVEEEAFDEAVQTYFSWAAEWDGSLPADTFFGGWIDLQREREPLALTARIVNGRLELTAPPDSAIKVTDKRVGFTSFFCNH